MLIIPVLFFVSTLANAQWTLISPKGIDVTSIVNTSNGLIVASSSKGLFFSSLTELKWEWDSNSVGLGYTYQLGHDKNVTYSANKSGLYRSMNYGKSWDTLNTGFVGREYRSIYAKGDTLIVGMNTLLSGVNGVLISLDKGNSWRLDTVGLTFKGVFGITASIIWGSNVLVANGAFQYYKSISDTSFTYFSLGNGRNVTRYFNWNETIIARTLSNGAYYSNDTCKTWKRVPGPNPNDTDLVVFHCSKKGIYASVRNRIYFSKNLGTDWKILPNASILNGVSITNTAYLTENTFLVGIGEGIVLAYEDTSEWTLQNNGFLEGTNCNDVVRKDNIIITTMRNWYIKSQDNGMTWKYVKNSPYTLNQQIYLDKDTLWFLSYSGLFKSYDYAETILNSDSIGSPNLKILFKDKENYFIGTNGSGVFYKKENENWLQINNGLVNRTVNTFCKLDTFILAGTNGGIYKLNVSSLVWYKINASLLGNTIYFLTELDSMLIAGTSNGCFKSTDGGKSWTGRMNGMLSGSVYYIREYWGKYFASTSTGFYYSTDKGQNWILFNDGIPSSVVLNKIYIFDREIYLASSKGLFKRQLSEFGLNQLLKIETKKLNVYPNPTNSIIKVEIDPLLIRKIEIINQRGENRYLRVDENGDIDLNLFVSGIYILKIQTQSEDVYIGKIIKL